MNVRFTVNVSPTPKNAVIDAAAQKVIAGDIALDRMIKLYAARLELGESEPTERQLGKLQDAREWRLNKIDASIADVDTTDPKAVDAAIAAIENQVENLADAYYAYNQARISQGQPASDEVESRTSHMYSFQHTLKPVANMYLFQSYATNTVAMDCQDLRGS